MPTVNKQQDLFSNIEPESIVKLRTIKHEWSDSLSKSVSYLSISYDPAWAMKAKIADIVIKFLEELIKCSEVPTHLPDRIVLESMETILTKRLPTSMDDAIAIDVAYFKIVIMLKVFDIKHSELLNRLFK